MNPPERLEIAGRHYVLRTMLSADLERVTGLEQRVHSHPWQSSHFSGCLRAGNTAVVLESEEGSDLVAYALIAAGGGEADLLNIVVAPEYQRRGIARGLLRKLAEELTAMADTLFLEVRQSNQPAIRLYRSLGFRRVGKRPGYYPAPGGGREDALVLALTLHEVAG